MIIGSYKDVLRLTDIEAIIGETDELKHEAHAMRALKIIINLCHTYDKDLQDAIFSSIVHEALFVHHTLRMIYRMAIRLRHKNREAGIDAPIGFVAIYEEYKSRYSSNIKKLPDMDNPDQALNFLMETATYPLWVGSVMAKAECDTYMAHTVEKAMARISSIKTHLIKEIGIAEAENFERDAMRELDSLRPKPMPSMGDALTKTLLSIQNFQPGLSTGLAELDQYARLQKGCLYIIAGRPAMGKTAVALHLARLAHGKKTIFISLEMPQEQLMKRLISSVGGIDHHVLTSGMAGATAQDMQKMGEAIDYIKNLNLQIFDDSSLSIDALIERCSRLKSDIRLDHMMPRLEHLRRTVKPIVEAHGYTYDSVRYKNAYVSGRDAEGVPFISRQIDDAVFEEQRWDILEYLSLEKRVAEAQADQVGLIIVDYLQLMSANKDFREQEIAAISRGLKSLAKIMDCPVIALAQINRGVESRPNKRPTLSDLRESGSIEQDADVVMMLYRDEVYNPETADRDVMEIGITKNRHGEIGVARCHFDKKQQRLSDIDGNMPRRF